MAKKSSVNAAKRRERKTLVDYLLCKVEVEDWHAVSDAANDLREVDVELEHLERKKKA